MINSKIFDRLDRSGEYFDHFNIRDTNLKKKLAILKLNK